MKKHFIFLLAIAGVMACNNKKKEGEGPGDKKDGKKTSESITYPYTPEYSSDFSLGDPNHAKLVLDFIKMFEDNRMSDMRPLLADTMSVDFSDGNKFKGPADSLLSMGQMFRSTFSKVVIKVDAWMPIHVNDKNEDYVLVWERDYNTDKQGKVDSIGSHAYYHIKNNKIASWSEFQAKLGPPGANK